MGKITAAITGIQGYLPEHILSNDDLSKMVETNVVELQKRLRKQNLNSNAVATEISLNSILKVKERTQKEISKIERYNQIKESKIRKVEKLLIAYGAASCKY